MEPEPPLPILVRNMAHQLCIEWNSILTPISLVFLARFSPDDRYSKQRVTLKRRMGLLLTQKPEDKM